MRVGAAASGVVNGRTLRAIRFPHIAYGRRVHGPDGLCMHRMRGGGPEPHGAFPCRTPTLRGLELLCALWTFAWLQRALRERHWLEVAQGTIWKRP
jgi:hypothetical protein